MSAEEKIQAMEALLDDLRNRRGDNLSPPWHGDELEKREAAIARGEETFEAWDNAKEKIRKAVR